MDTRNGLFSMIIMPARDAYTGTIDPHKENLRGKRGLM